MYRDDDPALEIAARTVLSYFWIEAEPDRLLLDEHGAALLALLANSAAKTEESHGRPAAAFYVIKRMLLRHAIERASDWWATPHEYGEKGYADTVVYIQTALERFSFHVRRDDPRLANLLERAPTSDRGWSGRALQPIAEQLTREWLASH